MFTIVYCRIQVLSYKGWFYDKFSAAIFVLLSAVMQPGGLTKRGPPPFWTPNLDPNLDLILDPNLDPNLDPILDLLKTNRPDCRTQLFGFQYHDDRLNSFSFFWLSESSILFNVLIISVSGNRIIIERHFILLQNVQFPTPRRHLEVKCLGGRWCFELIDTLYNVVH
jgi:hypothetical protein